MTPPSPQHLFETLDATWPPARLVDAGPWRLREGQGGGQRVSAATAMGKVTEQDIATAEQGMAALNQHPLFMIRPEDKALDTWLEACAYDIVDPVTLYTIPATEIAQSYPPAIVISAWPPLAMQTDLWKGGGIGPDRIAVMARADKGTAILCRFEDTPAATVFVAIHGDTAMVHALEVAPEERRKGMGDIAMRAAAAWAVTNGATWLTLAVTKANTGANALYRKLGMTPTGAYHYRRAPKATA